jgi:hypothetical protein
METLFSNNMWEKNIHICTFKSQHLSPYDLSFIIADKFLATFTEMLTCYLILLQTLIQA